MTVIAFTFYLKTMKVKITGWVFLHFVTMNLLKTCRFCPTQCHLLHWVGFWFRDFIFFQNLESASTWCRAKHSPVIIMLQSNMTCCHYLIIRIQSYNCDMLLAWLFKSRLKKNYYFVSNFMISLQKLEKSFCGTLCFKSCCWFIHLSQDKWA